MDVPKNSKKKYLVQQKVGIVLAIYTMCRYQLNLEKGEIMFENTCLNGLRVLDVTRYLAGPTCTQILSDLGAEVWKIERLGVGDDGRFFTPFIEGESGWYHAFNRNKRSFTLNFTTQEGKELFCELVKRCDILIENNAAGVMKRHGLDYDTVAKINPGIIYGSISGYGQKDSPYLNYPAFDGVAQAMGGVISLNGMEDQPGMKAGPGIIDLVSGYMCTIGVLAALAERERSGRGQHIDTCMMDAALNLTEHAVTYYSFTGENMPRCGNGHISLGMTGCFDTLDGKGSFYMNISGQKFALLILDAIGRPELKDDPRNKDNQTRRENRQFWDKVINEYTSKRTRKEIVEQFSSMHIPCGPVNTIADCFNDQHFRDRGEIVELEHPKIGKYAVTMTPFKMSRTPFVRPTPAEGLGESNDFIYGDILGKTQEEMDALKAAKII